MSETYCLNNLSAQGISMRAVTGQFGGSISQDSVCVQTMDGQLVFFQGKRRVFHRYLKDFLVPGPLCYIPPLDSFVTASSAFVVELYKYKVMLLICCWF